MHKVIIINHLISLWVTTCFWILISFVVFWLCKDQDKLKIHKIVMLSFAVIVFGYSVFKTTMCFVDIATDAYVTEEVAYSKYYHKRKLFEDPIYITREDGTSLSLAGGKLFPYGEYCGVVTYSKNSKIILDFFQNIKN